MFQGICGWYQKCYSEKKTELGKNPIRRYVRELSRSKGNIEPQDVTDNVDLLNSDQNKKKDDDGSSIRTDSTDETDSHSSDDEARERWRFKSRDRWRFKPGKGEDLSQGKVMMKSQVSYELPNLK